MNIFKNLSLLQKITTIFYSFFLMTNCLAAQESCIEDAREDKRSDTLLFQSPLAYDPSGVYPQIFYITSTYDPTEGCAALPLPIHLEDSIFYLHMLNRSPG